TKRAWRNEGANYRPAIPIGDPMRGLVCGTVMASRHPEIAEGDLVSGIGQWAAYQLGDLASVSSSPTRDPSR
ncbi:MAG: hypothetical protein IIA44_15895, partial [Acidobacteria bacterium]|nr:hypothetical protein [Acidobacteriota bacterium]